MRIFRLFSLGLYFLVTFTFTGCNFIPEVEFQTNIENGTVLNENNATIIFFTEDPQARLLLNFHERNLTLNGKDVTASTVVERIVTRNQQPPYRKIVWRIIYQPTTTTPLPEGNITAVLTVPYKNSFLKKYFHLPRLLGYTEVKKELNFFVDTQGPVINELYPKNGSTIHDKYQPITFTLYDEGIGVDTNKTLITINGQNYEGNVSYNETNLTLSPDSLHPLPEGEFNITISAQDRVGNRTQKTFTFIGQYDQLPPTIALIDPLPGSIIEDPLYTLMFKIVDDQNGTGVNPDSVYLHFIDTNATYQLQAQENNSSLYLFSPATEDPLPYGDITFLIHAADKAGNESNQTFHIFLREKKMLSATPVATPSSAYAPATIRFSPKVTTDTAIQTYYWDFNGDGTWDRQTIFPETYSWHYASPGIYRVTLKVVDANGEEANGTIDVQILNAPPAVNVELSPSNGNVPLEVAFLVQAQDNEGIAKYEWDFEGDGTWDYSSTQTGNTSHTYTTTGVFNAKLRVTDSLGASTIFTAPTTTVLAQDNDAPTVTALATPATGDAPLAVQFDANATDPLDKGFKLFAWDFDGDGQYDYNGTSPATTYTYTKAGRFYPRIKVVTVDDRISYDAAEITVNQKIELSLSTDTIDPDLGETVTIRTKLSADAPVQIVIEDSEHNVVRTVAPWQEREAGEYTDTWDGKSDSGELVKEGPYFVVLHYKQDGQVRTLDLRETTGGIRFNPSRTNAPRTFYPFDNQPLKITFTLNRAAEVVSFVGYSYSNTRIITFRNRQPLGRGSYTDIWYSQNDDGALVTPPPGRYFMYGVWGYTFASNTVYVKSGTYIENVSVTPAIVSPSSHEEEGVQGTLKISFTLNKEADVELTVFDAQTGTVVAGREYKNLSSGENTVTYDAKDNNGTWLHPGTYTLGLRAVDKRGYRSVTRYGIMRIVY